MKGLLMEVDSKNRGILLLNDGQMVVHRFRKGERFEVGQELVIEKPTIALKWNAKKIIALAVSLVLFIGPWSYAQPANSIYIDTNPSIRLDLNIYSRIIGAEGLNHEGLKVLADVQAIKHLDVKSGLRVVLDNLKRQGYIDTNISNRVYVSMFQSTSPFLKHMTQDIEDVLKLEKEEVQSLSYVIQEFKEIGTGGEEENPVSPFRTEVEGKSQMDLIEEIFSDSDFKKNFHSIQSGPIGEAKGFEAFDEAFEIFEQETDEDENGTDPAINEKDPMESGGISQPDNESAEPSSWNDESQTSELSSESSKPIEDEKAIEETENREEENSKTDDGEESNE